MRRLLIVLTVFASSSLLAQSGGLINGTRGYPQPNEGTTGTTLNSTAWVNASGQAITATIAQTAVPVRIVVGGAGTTGNAVFASNGTLAPCTMDATVASGAGGYYVIASTTNAGYCHPQSAAPASGTWLIGYLHDAATTSGATALVSVGGGIYGGGTSGTGSGTVNPNAGTAGAIAYYTAAGSSTTVDASPSAITGSTGINLAGNAVMWGTFAAPSLYLSNFFGNGVLSVGTANGGNTALITSGNSIPITTDISFSTTAGNVISKPLPARAVGWIIHCVLPFSFNTGNTGTSNIDFRLNLAQTPTGTGAYFTAVWWAPSPAAPIFQTFLVTASGVTIIGHAANLDSANTTNLYTMFIDGVLPANATSQNLQLQAVSSNGSALVRTGAYCRLE